ncbi:DUF3367 domain-containing protein, partial [Candidatus Woesearchaeota archaeon]|nr:DUF3367 domain-containing protein [Candidatus Woesearchaeota archaeon]
MVNNKENSQKNNQKKLNVVFIISIILLGLVPLIWYKPSFMVAGGDVFPLLIGKDVFYKHMFLWGTKNAGVTSDFQQYLMLESIWYFLLLLGFSVGFIQALINIFYFVGAGLSIYYLISIIYEERDSSVLRIGSFIAAVFYMFNFFIMLSNENYAIKWSYVFLPLLLAICVKIVKDIKNNQKPYKNIAYFSIISTILFSFATRNLGILVVDMVAVFLIFLYYFIFEKQTRKGLIKYSIILIIVVFLINMWWVISIFYNYFQPMLSNSLIEGTPTDVTEWSWTHVRSSFLNLFWLNGTWGWYPEYHTYVFKYSNPILLILVFIPVVIAFISLLLSKKIFDYYLAICVLVSFFLSKGIHPPLESINLFLYNHIPFFYVFRTAYGKFELIIVIFLALLICSGVIEAINKLNSSRKTHKIIGKNRIPYLFAVILPLIFIASTFPFITGEVIKDNKKDFPFSSYVVIPSYWRNATSWLSNQTGDFRVLVMPNNDFYLVPYKWGYYGVDTLASDLIQKPTLQVSDDYLINPNYKEIISEVYKVVMDSRVIVNNSNKSFSNNSNESFLLNKNASYSNASNNSNKAFVQLIKVMNVKYILQRNDIWWNFSNRHIIPPQTIRDYLSNNSLINLDKKFGELDIYKLSDEAF